MPGNDVDSTLKRLREAGWKFQVNADGQLRPIRPPNMQSYSPRNAPPQLRQTMRWLKQNEKAVIMHVVPDYAKRRATWLNNRQKEEDARVASNRAEYQQEHPMLQRANDIFNQALEPSEQKHPWLRKMFPESATDKALLGASAIQPEGLLARTALDAGVGAGASYLEGQSPLSGGIKGSLTAAGSKALEALPQGLLRLPTRSRMARDVATGSKKWLQDTGKVIGDALGNPELKAKIAKGANWMTELRGNPAYQKGIQKEFADDLNTIERELDGGSAQYVAGLNRFKDQTKRGLMQAVKDRKIDMKTAMDQWRQAETKIDQEISEMSSLGKRFKFSRQQAMNAGNHAFRDARATGEGSIRPGTSAPDWAQRFEHQTDSIRESLRRYADKIGNFRTKFGIPESPAFSNDAMGDDMLKFYNNAVDKYSQFKGIWDIANAPHASDVSEKVPQIYNIHRWLLDSNNLSNLQGRLKELYEPVIRSLFRGEMPTAGADVPSGLARLRGSVFGTKGHFIGNVADILHYPMGRRIGTLPNMPEAGQAAAKLLSRPAAVEGATVLEPSGEDQNAVQ